MTLGRCPVSIFCSRGTPRVLTWRAGGTRGSWSQQGRGEDRIGTGPPRSRTQVIHVDLRYWANLGSFHPEPDAVLTLGLCPCLYLCLCMTVSVSVSLSKMARGRHKGKLIATGSGCTKCKSSHIYICIHTCIYIYIYRYIYIDR